MQGPSWTGVRSAHSAGRITPRTRRPGEGTSDRPTSGAILDAAALVLEPLQPVADARIAATV